MEKKTIACLKYGNKYSAQYVNNLYSMIKRHTEETYHYVCFTDDSAGIDPAITPIAIKEYSGVHGWWHKLSLFDQHYSLSGPILFIDLDVVIIGNIDKFFEHEQGKFCITRDFLRGNENGMNSSCFRFEGGTYTHVYEDFLKDTTAVMKRLHGDQDWIQERINDHEFWPKSWLMSYKWEMKDKFSNKVKHHTDTSIAVFHGIPKPHELVNEDFIKHNWK